MSILSPTAAPPASESVSGPAAHPQWTVGIVLSRAFVILIGIAVGFVIGVVIGLMTGWIEIPILC